MLAKETGAGSTFDLPEEVLQVLPSDPFEQLDVARKITSIAISTRVSDLESEHSALRAQLAEKDSRIAELQSQIESIYSSLSDKLGQAQADKVRPGPLPCKISHLYNFSFLKKIKLKKQKSFNFDFLRQERLSKENEALTNTVRKLQRDISKVWVFLFLLIFACIWISNWWNDFYFIIFYVLRSWRFLGKHSCNHFERMKMPRYVTHLTIIFQFINELINEQSIDFFLIYV